MTAIEDGFVEEGIAAYVIYLENGFPTTLEEAKTFSSPTIKLSALFSCFSLSRQKYFYTIYEDEVKDLLYNGDYRFCGVVCFTSTYPLEKTTPFLRLYNASLDSHLYTVNPYEVAEASKGGFVVEGIVGNVWTARLGKPLYRLFKD